MDTHPLAHDAQGNPIKLPPQAAYWRVRRQTGRQGRPSNVYGPDGAPLVLPIAATADDLRDAGCSQGSYRLEALDGERRPLGIVAFTEIAADPDAPGDQESGYRGALTQTIKSQGEIIKAQGEALRSVAESVAKVQGDIMHSLAGNRSLPEPPQLRNAAIVVDAEAEPPPDGNGWAAYLPQLFQLAPSLLSSLQLFTAGWAKKNGLNVEWAPAHAAPALDTDAAPAPNANAANDGANGTADGVPPQFAVLFAQLTPDEQQTVGRLVAVLDLATLQRLASFLASLPPDVALAKAREMIAAHRRREAEFAQRAVFSTVQREPSDGK